MTISERAIVFECDGDQMVGVLALPAVPASCGLMILVGGAQYRVGSHRQFVQLARHVAEQGYPVMRFDFRGMGDSAGPYGDFEISVELKAALDAFCTHAPGVNRVALWGLCGSASAALMYAWEDSRICGLVLVNPWVRTQRTLAQARIKHYYVRRLMQREFWAKLAAGRVRVWSSIGSLARSLRSAFRRTGEPGEGQLDLQQRMLRGLSRFRGRTLVVLSGNDLAAQEFAGVAQSYAEWRRLLAHANVLIEQHPEADHTFSSREWACWAEEVTVRWLRQTAATGPLEPQAAHCNA